VSIVDPDFLLQPDFAESKVCSSQFDSSPRKSMNLSSNPAWLKSTTIRILLHDVSDRWLFELHTGLAHFNVRSYRSLPHSLAMVMDVAFMGLGG
jgi:hypothetical protein